MDRNTIGGTTCGHTSKHRSSTRRVGHTTSITGGFLDTEHTGSYLCHLIQRQLLVHTGFDDHLTQFGDALAHL